MDVGCQGMVGPGFSVHMPRIPPAQLAPDQAGIRQGAIRQGSGRDQAGIRDQVGSGRDQVGSGISDQGSGIRDQGSGGIRDQAGIRQRRTPRHSNERRGVMIVE